MHGVNLIPAYRQAAQRRRRRMRAWVTVTSIYAAFALAVCSGIHVATNDTTAVTAAELKQYDQHIAQLSASVADLRKQLSDSEIARKTAIAISDQPDWSILLSVLSNTLGDEVFLRDIQLKPDHDAATADKTPLQQHQVLTLQLRGYATTQPAVSQLVLRLQQLGLFDDVKLLRTGRENVNSLQAVAFEIGCTLSDAGGGGASK